MATMTEGEVVSTRIERDDRDRLERIAAEEDRTVSAVVRRALLAYLARHEAAEEHER
jgi:predicted transcriptional regulator